MKITMNEKYHFGYWQGWTITIDGVRYPKKRGNVYAAKSAIQALNDCLKYDREGRKSSQLEAKI